MSGRIKPKYQFVNGRVRRIVSLTNTPFAYRTASSHCLHHEPQVKAAFKQTLEMLAHRKANKPTPIFEDFPDFMGLATVPPVDPFPMVSFAVWNPARHQYVWEWFCDGPVMNYEERMEYKSDKLFAASQGPHLQHWMAEFGD